MRRGADGFALLLAGDIAEAVAKRLRMYVLRSKVTVTDVSAQRARIGVGGPAAAEVLRAADRRVPGAARGPAGRIRRRSSRFPVRASSSSRPALDAEALRARLAAAATPAAFDVWRWLTIRAGMPVITAATQDAFVAQAANWDVLGGIDFQKGCYTGQEIIARTQYLGRLKERTLRLPLGSRTPCPATGSSAPPSTTSLAAPWSMPRARRTAAAISSRCCKSRRRNGATCACARPTARSSSPLPLPYAIPAAKAPREREA